MRMEAPVPREVLAAIRAPFLDTAADLIDPPVIQPLGLLLDLAGEALRARLFVFQAATGEEACLRPDFTAAVAHHHVEARAQAGRYRYEGKAFRDTPREGETDHPQEFLQMGIEVYGGSDRVRDDAEIMTLAWRAASAGGRADLHLQLGDVELFAAFLEAIGAPMDARKRLCRVFGEARRMRAELERAQKPAPRTPADDLADRWAGLTETKAAEALSALWAEKDMGEIGGRSAAEIVQRLRARAARSREPGLTPEQAALIGQYLAISDRPDRALAAISALADNPELSRAIDGWRQRLDLLEQAGAPLDAASFDAGVGRGFNYYDGFLFRIARDADSWGAPIASGGRYDTLLTQLSGVASSAVGCMVRPARAWTGGGR